MILKLTLYYFPAQYSPIELANRSMRSSLKVYLRRDSRLLAEEVFPALLLDVGSKTWY